MPFINCWPDGSCPYQYTCNNNNICEHNPVFPLQPYPLFIYILYPIASALCNVSGNSVGQFKVLLLMNGLNYSESDSTVLCYPLILGPALYNFVYLIFKRHPSKDTSLVDYYLVTLILPNSLYGAIIGAMLNKLVPPIAADICIILLLSFFCFKFFKKLRKLILKERKEKQT